MAVKGFARFFTRFTSRPALAVKLPLVVVTGANSVTSRPAVVTRLPQVAVMASFTNLALSLAQLGTRHLNGVFEVTREVKDVATGAVTVPADYSQLGDLYTTVIVIGLVLPMLAIVFVKTTRFRSA